MRRTDDETKAIIWSLRPENKDQRTRAFQIAYNKLPHSEQAIIDRRVEILMQIPKVGRTIALEILAAYGQYVNRMET